MLDSGTEAGSAPAPMPRVTIIETGLVGADYRARHGSYPQMFERMIRAADASVAFEIVSACRGEALPHPAALQSVLITGSPAGVYDALEKHAMVQQAKKDIDADPKWVSQLNREGLVVTQLGRLFCRICVIPHGDKNLAKRANPKPPH